MARRPLFCSLRGAWLITAFAFFALRTSPIMLADEPAPARQFVEVKLWVVEVSKTKLRSLGFDWDAVPRRPGSAITNDENLTGFLEALDQNGIASMHFKPRIATESGHTATIEISPFRKVEVTPTIIDAEHIAFDYHVEVTTRSEAQPDKAGRRLVSACSTELKSGATQLLSETTTQQRTAKGEPTQTTLLVLAQATIVK
jgi:hypothetical protein